MRLLLIGGGKMGSAMLAGWKKAKLDLTADVITPHPDAGIRELADHVYLAANETNAVYDVVVLAVKPQIIMDLLPVLGKFVTGQTVFLSIITGKTLATLEQGLGNKAAVIRAMPNTPSLIGQGMTVCIANAHVSPSQKAQIGPLLDAMGQTLWITDEDQMHAVTGLSGSGPAYVFAMIEAMQKAGQSLGLADDIALQLAIKTVQGAAQLAVESDKHPAQLREQVTSPNGTTAAALAVLQGSDGALDQLINGTITAASNRSRELA